MAWDGPNFAKPTAKSAFRLRVCTCAHLPKKNEFRPQEKLEFGIAKQFSFRKYPKSAPT